MAKCQMSAMDLYYYVAVTLEIKLIFILFWILLTTACACLWPKQHVINSALQTHIILSTSETFNIDLSNMYI